MSGGSSDLIDYRSLFEAGPGLFLVLDPRLTILAVSDGYCRATGTEREKMLGRGIFDVFPDDPSDPGAAGTAKLRASLDRVVASRCPDRMADQDHAAPLPDAKGGGPEERCWSPLNLPVLDRQGALAWIVHRVEDVTDLRRLRREGEAQEEAADAQRLRIHELQEANHALARQIRDNGELQLRVSERNAELRAEIGERRKAEEALKNTTAFLDTVIENLPGMLFVKDAVDHRFVLFNRAGEELLGYSRSELIGKSDYDFFPKDQADQFVARDRAMIESGGPTVTPEESITTRYKGVRTLRTVKIPVQDAEGRPQYLLGFSEDITDRKAIEQQLHQALKVEAIGKLTGGVAHDFNNLLTVIISSVELLDERWDGRDPEGRKYLRNILQAGQQGAELTKRLLAFARRQPLEPRAVNVNSFVTNMKPLLERTLGEHIDVRTELGAELWEAEADPNQVEAALLNLAINARDAMDNGGQLTIETANLEVGDSEIDGYGELAPGAYISLAVSDDGCGMAPEVLASAIEPFFTTKDVGKGTGLGLSMVFGFAKQSGGHMTIASEVGRGTTVRLYLPRIRTARPPADRAAFRAVENVGRGELILVAEDDNAVREIAVNMLVAMGYRVAEAANGQLAIAAFERAKPIDLLFTDVIMPGGISGPSLALELRRRQPGLRVLYTSGYTEDTILHQGKLDEGVMLLNKPYRRDELARKIRAALTAPTGE